MRQKPGTAKPSAESMVKDIRRRTRKHHSAEEKIRIVLEGLRGEDSIAELCRRERIATSLYYSWGDPSSRGSPDVFGKPFHQAAWDWQQQSAIASTWRWSVPQQPP